MSSDGGAKNSKLFAVGSAEAVDAETGESVPIEGGGFRMLPGPPGTCEWCHVRHDPADPHNRDSLSYQTKFHVLYGRSPTWTDAMAHCRPDVRRAWRAGLREKMREHGISVPADLLDE